MVSGGFSHILVRAVRGVVVLVVHFEVGDPARNEAARAHAHE
jgi:hypothetical protein